MKKILSLIASILTMILVLNLPVSAHSSKSSVNHLPEYTYWDIFEPPDNPSISAWTCHSASNNISVSYGDLSVLSSANQNTFKGYIDYAIGKWAECSFGEKINMYKSSTNPVVRINAYSDPSDANWGYNDFVNAKTVSSSGTGGKHFTSLDIYINVASTKVPISNATRCKYVLAHELGHAIGLADLTTSTSDYTYSSYLMGRNNYTITAPTSAEVKGAAVILGLHTNHTFKTYSPYNGTFHRAICDSCDGYKIESHNRVNGVCAKCGEGFRKIPD